ncbi:MAG: carboxylating nicotinate-nucleotide diphosphorylase [Bdellovibrionales bacterium]
MSEDIPHGDITSDSLGIRNQFGSAQLIAKEDLVLSGSILFQESIKFHDSDAQIKWYFNDGDTVLEKQCIALIQCNLVQLLKAERVGINFLGHLSGIATKTRMFVKALGDSKTKILDTRKTTPLLRALEKQAVVHGGGQNHRMNLSDMAMLKENHLRLMNGNIELAVEKIRKVSPKVKIEVETTNLAEVKAAVATKCDRIMLDNMDDETIQQALELIPSNIETEASGNMTIERMSRLAHLGLDYISVGSITHSAPCADMSLLFDWDDTNEAN